MLTTLALLLTTHTAWADGPIYVDRDAPGPTHDGASWATAYVTLQGALDVATSGDEVWVAAGVYTPTAGIDRAATFALLNGVGLYGGFVGVESVRDARDPHVHVTVLSGDLDGNDTTTPDGVVTDTTRITGTNAYHAVTAQSVIETAILDGFTITAGKADGDSQQSYNMGGGMYNVGASPTVRNVIFGGNQANHGGGMYNSWYSSPTLIDVTFSGNYGAGGTGGGMSNYYSSPTLLNATFSGNQASAGGGMHNSWYSSPALVHVTFSGNQASTGGGMYNYAGSNPILDNCILWGNTAGSGAQMYNSGSSLPVINYSLVQGGCPGDASCDAHLLTIDPLFVDADGADHVVGTPDDDLRLRDNSPAIDAGDNGAVPADTYDLDGDGDVAEPLPYDLAGSRRFASHPQPDTGAGTAPLVDMGAYERPGL